MSGGMSEERRDELGRWVGPHGNHDARVSGCPWCSMSGPSESLAEVDRLRADLEAARSANDPVVPQSPAWEVGDWFTIDPKRCHLFDGLISERRGTTGKTPGKRYRVDEVQTGGVHFTDDDGESGHFVGHASMERSQPRVVECETGPV